MRSLAFAYVYRDICKPFGQSEILLITCSPENSSAYGLYKSMGFVETGRSDDDENELSLSI